MVAIGVVLSGTLIAAAVAIDGYGNVRSTIDVIVGKSVPSMKTGMSIAYQTERLVALAPALTSASDRATLDSVSARVRQVKEEFSGRLSSLRAAGADPAQVASIEETSTALLANLTELDKAASATHGSAPSRFRRSWTPTPRSSG